jgi:hypothetical protein
VAVKGAPTRRRQRWPPNVAAEMLKDPLGELPRRHRRDLIIASTLAILVTVTGIVPKNVGGIELGEESRGVLLWALALGIVYQWVAFLIYVWPDRIAYQARLRNLGYRPKGLGEVPMAAVPVAARTSFDILFPPLLTLTALVFLLWTGIPAFGSPAESSWLGSAARVSMIVACGLVSLVALGSLAERFISLTRWRRREGNSDV